MSKIRIYIAVFSKGVSSLGAWFAANPDGVEWISNHRPAGGDGKGLTAVQVNDRYDFSAVPRELGKYIPVPRRLDEKWLDAPAGQRAVVKGAIDDGLGRVVDDSDWDDIDDAMCVILRNAGEGRARKRLRAHRTEDFIQALLDG